ncbi:MAG: DUF1592 domain-containing protein [Opitutus sp.]
MSVPHRLFHRFGRGPLSASLGLLSLGAAAAEFAPPPIAVERLCFDCHGDGYEKGSFALDELIAQGDTPEHRGLWLKVWKNVRHEFMPPANATEEASADDRREIARWIERTIFKVDPQHVDPGAVTIRRLNREEYQNTINDLLGTDFELRERLLPDDSAHGFDNIGDAQTLSPVQFVRYLDLAEWIVSQVVVETGAPLPRQTFDAVGPKPKGGGSRKSLAAKDGMVERSFPVKLDHDGRYRLDVDLAVGGWQEYAGDATLTFRLDDQLLGERTLPVGGEVSDAQKWEFTGTKGEHTLVFRATLVANPALAAAQNTDESAPTPTPATPARPIDPEFARQRSEDRRMFEEEFGAPPPRRADAPPEMKFNQLNLAVVGPLAAGVHGEYPEPHRKIFFRGSAPDRAADRRTYAKEILRRVADRAFHRPVDESSINRLADLALHDQNFERGVGSALTAILSSSRFLFREEPTAPSSTGRSSELLDEHALATRLSYLLWVSLPDDELLGLASAGQLRAHLGPQLQRMLADPKSQRLFRDFSGQWLRTRNVLMTAITPGSVADRLTPVREPMKAETDLFFEYVARQDRDLIELLTANYTFLNEPLAKFYGIPGVVGEEMRKVMLPPESHRGGVLTHGSILVSTSNPNRTSPVKRGVFVLDTILGTPPPPPPAAVPDLDEAKKHGEAELKTLRSQLAAHRADRACAACHAHFDPIGLALENFSYLGRWREKERGEPVDASGKMVTGETFSDFAGMQAVLASRKDKFYRCVTEKLMTYALGRGLEPSDAPTVDAITDRLLNEGGKFSTLLTSIIESPAFQQRRSDPDLLAKSP